MGYAKERIMEEMEQGWKYKDDLSICDRCLYDPYLKAFVNEHATLYQCSFCHRRSRKKPTSIKFDALMAVIVDAVNRYYGRTIEELTSWDSEDGRYIGDTLDTYDLIHYRIPPASEYRNVLHEIVDSLGDDTWCEHQPYALNDVERHEYSWEAFCQTVKHQTRYFFSDLSDWEEDEERVPVGLVLNELRDMFSSADLIRMLPAETKIFRGRLHDPALQCETWDALGPPPSQYAPSNRMSAAGIAMFYGAFDIRTIQAEVTANSETEEKRVLTIASWLNPNPLVLLDLTELPELPSFYNGAKY